MVKRIQFWFCLLCAPIALAQDPSTKAADSLYALGNYAKAINEYAKIGGVSSNLQIARAYNAMRDYDKSVKQYEAVIEKDSSAPLPLFELGKLYDKTKRYEDAVSVFLRLTRIHRENPEFFYYLGKAQQQLGDYTNGNQALFNAVKLDSTHLRSIFLLGKYYVSVQEPANAHEILDLGLQTAPNDVALINLKALAHFNNGFYRDAAPLFERLIQLGEYEAFVLKKLGYSLYENSEIEKAKKVYRELEKIPHMEPDAYFGLGEVYAKEMKLDSAEVYFIKAIEERRYLFDKEYSNLGRVAVLQRDYQKALRYYQKAHEEDPNNALTYWQICTVADRYYKDPQTKLNYYQKLLEDYDQLYPFLKERAQKRISELKEELHFDKE